MNLQFTWHLVYLYFSLVTEYLYNPVVKFCEHLSQLIYLYLTPRNGVSRSKGIYTFNVLYYIDRLPSWIVFSIYSFTAGKTALSTLPVLSIILILDVTVYIFML